MPVQYPPQMDQAEMPGSIMQGGQYNADSLADVARPSHEDEDLEVVQGIKALAALTKQLIQKVKSGPVEDALTSILSKLTSTQKKFDTLMQEGQDS